MPRCTKALPPFAAVKIDTSSVDLNTLSLKQLRQILADRGVSCVGCLEKSDFVRKVEETNEQEL